ncbi:aminodeoxychorismate/anthranilate synthase component II [Enterococcus hirae]|nr:aminodeoxychorismate/anthranilate synthase component II [Enterococcus hirae]
MILLVDNYDSFTYNLVQLVARPDLGVLRNDDPALLETAKKAQAVILSPGPGRPQDAGKLLEVIRQIDPRTPLLGICLGHQALGSAFGGKVIRAQKICHGKIDQIRHDGRELFQGLGDPLPVMRYHSLALAADTLPKRFTVTAKADDGEIMAIQDQEYPRYGLQFHPESIGTPQGKSLVTNFLKKMEESA